MAFVRQNSVCLEGQTLESDRVAQILTPSITSYVALGKSLYLLSLDPSSVQEVISDQHHRIG